MKTLFLGTRGDIMQLSLLFDLRDGDDEYS
jgi:hypothetical protein